MTCPRCVARGQTWAGDAPVCAFESGTFDPKAWNCATMNELRDLAERTGAVRYFGDTGECRAAALPGPCGLVVLGWYKNRGRTSAARYVGDDTDEALTLDVAEATIAAGGAA